MDDATADFVRGVRLLLHEVWLTDAEAHLDDRSVTALVRERVAQIAQRAAVGELMPIHHKPTRSREKSRRWRGNCTPWQASASRSRRRGASTTRVARRSAADQE